MTELKNKYHQSLGMWSYWRDREGIADAIEHYYDDVLPDHDALKTAYHAIRANELYIDKIMTELEDEYYGEESESE